jgi:hypothetical protein
MGLPCHLETLVRRLPFMSALTCEVLIQRHTLFPVFSPFLKESVVGRVQSAMRGHSGVHQLLGYAATRVFRHTYGLVCPACLKADKFKFGYGYWHREHQADGVWVCATHGVPLCRTNVRPFSTFNSVSFIAADDALQIGVEFDKRWMGHLLAIARDVYYLLNEYQDTGCKLELLKIAQRRNLSDKCYLDESGRLRIDQINYSFIDFFGADLLVFLGCMPLGPFHGSWLTRMCRNFEYHQHPLYHLLLGRFLGFSNIGEMFEQPRAETSVPVKELGRLRRGKTRYSRLLGKGKKKEWIKALKHTPSGRMRSSHSALYCWLHRNCRPWLKAHAPDGRSIRKPDLEKWKKLDRKLSHLIPHVTSRIKRRCPPIRASRSRIATECGHIAWLVRDHKYLPLSNATLKKHTETSIFFADRRLKLLHGRFNKLWKLRVSAGISPQLARSKSVARALRERLNQ